MNVSEFKEIFGSFSKIDKDRLKSSRNVYERRLEKLISMQESEASDDQFGKPGHRADRASDDAVARALVRAARKEN